MSLFNNRITGVSFDDFSLYGCPNCGCNKTLQLAVEKGVSSNVCKQCNTQFITFGNGISQTKAKFPISEKDPEGFLIFLPVQKGNHPREGIPCHKLVEFDEVKSPDDEESCEFLDEDTTDISSVMRFVVKGEKAAKRIQRIFDMLKYEEYEKSLKAFVQCEIDEQSLDYMYAVISLFFDSSDYLRIDYLKNLITENDTISKKMVLAALTKNFNKEFKRQPH